MGLGGERFTIAAGAHEVTVVGVGAGLQRYAVDGVDVTCAYGDDELPPKGCGTTLVPWPNRIRDGRYTFDGTAQQLALTDPDAGNAIHGLGRWARWAAVEHGADRLTMRLDVVPQKGYPFEIRAEVTYALHPDTGLTVTLVAENRGRARAPFGAGSHPYLSTRGHRLDDVTLRLPVRQRLDLDDRGLPTGAHPVVEAEDFRAGRSLGAQRFDAGFTDLVRDGEDAEVRTPSGGARLWLDESFRYLQVFTVDRLTAAGDGIAIEPMTCAPDAFNSGAGLIVLDPGESWRGRWGITPLPAG